MFCAVCSETFSLSTIYKSSVILAFTSDMEKHHQKTWTREKEKSSGGAIVHIFFYNFYAKQLSNSSLEPWKHSCETKVPLSMIQLSNFRPNLSLYIDLCPLLTFFNLCWKLISSPWPLNPIEINTISSVLCLSVWSFYCPCVCSVFAVFYVFQLFLPLYSSVITGGGYISEIKKLWLGNF